MNNFHTNKIAYDECVSKGICSISPDIAYIQELIKEYIRELSFYIFSLKQLGITNEKIRNNIIETVSGLILNLGYSEESLQKIISMLSANLLEAKNLYVSVCEKNGIKPGFLKSFLKIPKKIVYANSIRQGQNILNNLILKTNPEQKNLFELMYLVSKSISVHLLELRDFGIDIEDAYDTLLKLFNVRNTYKGSSEKIIEELYEGVKLDHELLMKLQKTREEKYGVISPAEVSVSTRPNKAILVSGGNLRELELLLEATKDRCIDIYTHGHMLMAHAFPKFKKYPHLAGHFGQGTETYLMDFAQFPGPILLTKNSFYKVESLYRSRIYTTDIIAPKGVGLIKDNNFEPLIQSAISSKGFIHKKDFSNIRINLDEKNILSKIENITEKMEKGQIKHFFTIGVSNHVKTQKDYFEKFLSLLNEDCFVMSFSYTNHKDNVLLIESDYGFPILYKSLEMIANKIPLTDLNPKILYTRCEVHTISNVIYMHSIGIKNIYFTDCPPQQLNPALIEFMGKKFGLKKYKNPESDFKEMTQECF